MKKHLLFTIFISFAIHSYANSYYGKHISIDNGLSQESVTCIEYNSHGSLWIGTRFGLNEYRNGSVRSFVGNKANGLEGGYINSLFSDRDDNLWVMTDKGLFLYDESSDSFTLIDNNVATCIHEKGDTLYIGGNHGISLYDRNSGTIIHGSANEWTDLLKIFAYDEKIVCIDKRNGVHLIDDGKTILLDIPEITEATIMSASIYDGTLILSVLGEGVVFYDLNSRTTKKFIRNGQNGLKRDLILCSEIIGGKLWLGTDGNGIEIMDMGSYEVSSFYNNISFNTGTDVPKSVTTIYPDPIGNIWIGGVHFGVTGLKETSISTYLNNNVINCFHASSDGCLYIGTDGDGIYRNIGDKNEKIASTADMKITTIADYDRKHLIICAYNSGFHLLDRNTGKLSPFIIIDKKTNDAECLYGNAPEICTLGDGRMLIFAVNNYVHNPVDGSFHQLYDTTEGDAKDLRAIFGEGHSTYTYTKTGIYRINLGEMQLERIHTTRTSGESSINTVIIRDNEIMYGTDYGLFTLNMTNGEISPIRNDLITKVTELCYGNDGEVWIGADNTLFAYHNGNIELLGENRGVAANEFTASLLKDGMVYFGGSQGFLKISPHASDSTDTSRLNKHFSLHDLSLNGRTIHPEGGKVSVPYKYESLVLSVSLQGSDPLERFIYRYSIDGNTSYSFDAMDNTISIPSLKSGSYDINVSFPMKMGEWSTPQTVLELRVKTPWYSSIWMIIIYVFCLIATVTTIILSMRNKMMKELAEKMSRRDTLFVTKFERYISEHLGENNLNVEQIAADLAMSRATLYTKVKNAYSCGIGEYIEAKRMEKACEMLENGTESVAEIAEAIGYATPRYFSMRFKKATGESPLNYRKKNRSR